MIYAANFLRKVNITGIVLRENSYLCLNFDREIIS
jgi:hypothetical protein